MAGAPAQQSQAPTSVPGGNFVNLQDYLKANEGQGKAMADKVVGGVREQADKATGLGSMTVSPMGQAQQTIPDSGRRAGMTMDAARNAESGAGLAQTQGGREQLLNQAYGSGRSQGESNLDNALMGQGAGGRLEQLKGQYGGLAAHLGAQQQAGMDQWSASMKQRDLDAGRPDRTAAAYAKHNEAQTAERTHEADLAEKANHPPPGTTPAQYQSWVNELNALRARLSNQGTYDPSWDALTDEEKSKIQLS